MADNLYSNSAALDLIYKHSGFSSTILDSFASPGTSPAGITWDGTDLYSADNDTGLTYKHSGFSSTILDSFTSPGAVPTGLTWDGTDLYSEDYDEERIYKHLGFSSTILDSFASPDIRPSGLTWDGTNLYSSDYFTDLIYKHLGFSSTILDSFTSPGTLPTGLTWDGTDLYSADNVSGILYKHSGFSSTILDSFASPGTLPTGLTWESFISRVGNPTSTNIGKTFLRVYQHLLPNARAWRTTIDKRLREFFEGLSGLGADIKEFYDLVLSDIDPQQTRELTAWERQFGLANTLLTEQERRDRLEAAWATTGGQSPYYIQTTLQANGFDVYVHDWWEPGTEQDVNVHGAPGTTRNPLDYIAGGLVPATDCGEDFMECGEAEAECGEYFGSAGYVLVNKGLGPYTVSSDADTWPYYLYIGAEEFGLLANVSESRRDEFEALCLKLCPCQLWLGMLINYG